MEVIQDKIHHIYDNYLWALTQSDPRVKDWPLMQSYVPTLVLMATYLLIVQILPIFMKNREPVKLKYVLFMYNTGLVVLNFHIFYELITATYHAGYSYSCQQVYYTDDYQETRIAKALWWYYFSKLIEFLDTIFFILRKKNNQVSFLHVYHHASMFPIWWIGVKWVAGGQSFFGAMINSFIHVIMYSYYGIAVLGPQFQKYLWWKKYLTRLQLLQFFICLVKTVQSLYIDCEFPKWMQYLAIVYGSSIMGLFCNFYYCEYVKLQKLRKAKVQFVAGMIHAAQSLLLGCEFPMWMQYALIFYGGSILSLFLNFYFHAYIKSKQDRASRKKQSTNGHVSNGHNNGAVSNGTVHENGDVKENKKSK